MPANSNPPYRHIILAGDRLKDVFLPEEGKHRLSLAKESDSDEPISRMEAIKKLGGLSLLEWILDELLNDPNDTNAPNVPLYSPRHEELEGDLPPNEESKENLVPIRELEEVHWGLRLLPRDLYATGPEVPKVYRVTDRHLHTPPFREAPVFSPKCPPDESLFREALTIIADYGHDLTKQQDWTRYAKPLRITTNEQVRRIIILARRLPYPVLKGRRPMTDEKLWNTIYDTKGKLHPSQRDTLVITSLDRLRQDGAQISKRVSWDQTFEDFANELKHFLPLRRLGLFGHLVVRIGVSGAFYCKTSLTKDGGFKDRELTLIYDPRAAGDYFRDLLSQGNVFGTRAAFTACIAKALFRGDPKDQPSLIREGIGDAIRTSQFLYRRGFGDTLAEVRTYPRHLKGKLCANLEDDKTKNHFLDKIQYDPLVTHTEWGIVYANLLHGHTDISDYILKERLTQRWLESSLKERRTRRWLLEYRRFRCAMQIVLSGVDTIINQYTVMDWMKKKKAANQLTIEEVLLELTLSERIDVETEISRYFSDLEFEWLRVIPLEGQERESTVLSHAKIDSITTLLYQVKRAQADAEALLSELRTQRVRKKALRRAILEIVDHMSGSVSADDRDQYGLSSRDREIIDYLVYCCESNDAEKEGNEAHGRETENAGPIRTSTMFGNWRDEKKMAIKSMAIKLRRISVPFNFPIGRFGQLRVVGKKDVEAFNDIRNRILFHVQSGTRKPLSIAVFGPPGSGKSFGVTEIAREHGTAVFQEILCNLSQGDNASFLHRTFVTIGDALAAGKIPLVFFDEFDSTFPGQEGMAWLKYFLQPMQDGYYQHPDGRMSVGNSIFIFAGGTHSTYEEFRKKVKDVNPRHEKLLDFVSRLKGFVDIPHISPCDEAEQSLEEMTAVLARKDRQEIPYLRRAMLIRSILEKKRMIRPFNNQPAGYEDRGYGLLDVELLRALLLVNAYRHGARSIAALLDIASPFYNTIAKASLPSNDQLDMHTDQKDFNMLLKDSLKKTGELSDDVKSRLLNGTWDFATTHEKYRAEIDAAHGTGMEESRAEAVRGFANSGVKVAKQLIAQGRPKEAKKILREIRSARYDPKYEPALDLLKTLTRVRRQSVNSRQSRQAWGRQKPW
jgi:hypothetical protein